MLWVLALVSVPMQENGLTYEFLGIPPESIVFEVELPLRADQQHWRHFDYAAGQWVDRTDVSPYGRENFLCEQCAVFLPGASAGTGAVLVSLSNKTAKLVRETFFDVCGKQGHCSETLYIDGKGKVYASR
jgi:hypothetical protein